MLQCSLCVIYQMKVDELSNQYNMYVCMYVRTYVRTYVHTYKRTYICMHACMDVPVA